MKKGTFITVEGGEGAGKTTVLMSVEQQLKERGYEVVCTREPGGVLLAERIRALLLHTHDIDMDERTEALLYAAARREHLMKKIVPALQRGQIVLCDRFIDSSLAYQGYAREIGVEEVRAINMFAVESYMPELTLYFSLDPSVGLTRIEKDQGRERNRLDHEKLYFHEQVKAGYETLANKHCDRIKMIDASEPLPKVIKNVMIHIDSVL
ncbi:dTMP kinase [Shouchella lonarensis]|uniref:Thymidylate kinase n=1 Tax=Shouchella lonarensis TaxID=1464122 RepID=A0A1G6P0U1_9BACI|nr:dTMP kinase [Shouchella lonarensis]SDC73822.1 thymidylate kinase [Shouchella lonarensis]